MPTKIQLLKEIEELKKLNEEYHTRGTNAIAKQFMMQAEINKLKKQLKNKK